MPLPANTATLAEGSAAAPHTGRTVRRRPLLLFGVTVLSSLLYLALSLSRWNAGRATNYDLTIFSQYAQDWAAGRLPYASVQQRSLFSVHVSPITWLFGPAWLIWPDPRILLILQAACFGAAVAIVFGFARPTVGNRWALALLAVAVFSRGLIAGSLFDVHEVAFAAPLTVGLCAAVRSARRWPAWGCAVGLALVKEDLGLTVVVAGCCWWIMHRRHRCGSRDAFVLVAFGVLASVVAAAVIHRVNGTSPFASYFSPAALLHGSSARFEPVLVFVVTACVVGLRSPIALIAVPTLLWRVMSGNPLYWSTEFHYDVVTASVAVVAVVDGIARSSLSRSWRVMIGVTGVVSIGLGVITVAHRWGGIDNVVSRSQRLTQVQSLAVQLPPGSRVAAINDVGPYLADRVEVFELGPGRDQPVDYAFYATSGGWSAEFPDCARRSLERAAEDSHWPIRRNGPYVLVRVADPLAASRSFRDCG